MEGILLVDKATGKSSFHLVSILRRLTGIRKIGHAGTLDPLATGVMVMLIGATYTRQSQNFVGHDKEYRVKILLGQTTDSYDSDGTILTTSPLIPTLAEVETALLSFQGALKQIPPMFSAKQQGGKRLYELARQGITVERPPIDIKITTTLLSYSYPYLELLIEASSGTYIRTISEDLGQLLGCGATVIALTRTRSGPFLLSSCVPTAALLDLSFPYHLHLNVTKGSSHG